MIHMRAGPAPLSFYPVRYANSKQRSERTPRPIPTDQDQRDGEEVWADDLHPSLVRLEGENLWLLPVEGSETRWCRNVLQNPSIRVDARGVEAEYRASPLTDAKDVKSVIEKFREKYGATNRKASAVPIS